MTKLTARVMAFPPSLERRHTSRINLVQQDSMIP
jgi:hypothetical protein